MFHCNGWCFTWGITAMGATHVCLRKVVPEEIYRIIAEEGVTHLCAAPTILVGMSTYATEHKIKIEKQLEIMTAGAPPAPTVIQNMESVGANIMQTYGLTEVFGPHSVCRWQTQWDGLPADDRAQLKARQGVPYIVAQYMDAVDPTTMQPVPRDGKTMGEIVMRGNNVMLGYYTDPEATDTAFKGGWFHSGDLAVMHPDNYIQIMDQKRTLLSAAAKTSPPSKWRTPCTAIRQSLKSPWCQCRVPSGGKSPKPLWCPNSARIPRQTKLSLFVKTTWHASRPPNMSSLVNCPKPLRVRFKSLN
jgi:fatty-acyl-CoA synthase